MALSSVLDWLLSPIADSTGRTVGALGILGGGTHLANWTLTTESAWYDALSAGDVGSALPELASYATAHPAYVVAAVFGLCLLVVAE